MGKLFFVCLLNILLNYLSYRRALRINDIKGQVLLLMVPTMPDEIRNGLFHRLCSIFPEEFKHMDSSTSNGTFPCTYFTMYNRYSVQVCLHFYLNILITYYDIT
jgi:hypothetical protein